MTVLIAFISIFLIAFVSAFVSAWMTRMLDFSMDYGHLLYKIRLKKARDAADQPLLAELNRVIRRIPDTPLENHVQAVHEVYQKIAAKNNSFLLWICVFCLGTRVNVFILLVSLIFIVNFFPALFVVLYVFMQPALTFYYLKKFDE